MACLQTGGQAKEVDSEAYQPPSSLSINLQLTSSKDSRVCHTSWSNHSGRHLLAAATDSNTICILTLSVHFHALQAQLLGLAGGLPPSHLASSSSAASQPYELLISTHMPEKIVAMEWTQAADGLLMADDQGNVTLHHLSWPAPSRMSLDDVDTLAAPAKPTFTHAWAGRSSIAVQPQNLITAGACVVAPSASATAGTRTVTVWWPQHVEAGSAQSQAGWAVAEQLRHPAPIAGLQWSPGALQKGMPEDTIALTAAQQASR